MGSTHCRVDDPAPLVLERLGLQVVVLRIDALHFLVKPVHILVALLQLVRVRHALHVHALDRLDQAVGLVVGVAHGDRPASCESLLAVDGELRGGRHHRSLELHLR